MTYHLPLHLITFLFVALPQGFYCDLGKTEEAQKMEQIMGLKSKDYPGGGVTESRLTLLTTQQASKATDDVLRQGILTSLGQLADREDSRLLSPKSLLLRSRRQFLL